MLLRLYGWVLARGDSCGPNMNDQLDISNVRTGYYGDTHSNQFGFNEIMRDIISDMLT